ncbi:NAD(P)H-binding protein [Nonomuraea sp. MCN248]|uniref:NAD(P)H-binding protein n=1 Tax=Nonomuraea corallina TaxID=2989783 RepID=A0ABT4SMM3_9ACTN|nr:NAD(P)H-binding protein [Nonomuraea corallina]MDA0638477.1 NAD(P)H-binding protein [Nonomuraea corallina]
MTSVVVTGASGRLGRAVTARLAAEGFEVRALSRTRRADAGGVRWAVADLATGRGVAGAVADSDAIVHLASAPYRGRYTRRVELDGTGALLAGARATRTGQLIYLSIVGVDRVPWGYYRTKLAAERLVRDGGVPWTTLRVTQFHEFAAEILAGMARLGAVVADPGIPVQPVDVRDVAGHLASLIRRGPSGEVEEYGGPEVLTMAEAARLWLDSRRSRRPLLRMRVPGRLGRAFRAGHLTTPAGPAGKITWQEYLAGQDEGSP